MSWSQCDMECVQFNQYKRSARRVHETVTTTRYHQTCGYNISPILMRIFQDNELETRYSKPAPANLGAPLPTSPKDRTSGTWERCKSNPNFVSVYYTFMFSFCHCSILFHIVPYCSILFHIVPYCSMSMGQKMKLHSDDCCFTNLS